MINEEFLRLLRCPLNLGPLRIADPALVARLNEQVATGHLVNRGGEKVDRPLDSGLVDQKVALVYPVHDDIPCLLVDEAIPLNQLEGD